MNQGYFKHFTDKGTTIFVGSPLQASAAPSWIKQRLSIKKQKQNLSFTQASLH